MTWQTLVILFDPATVTDVVPSAKPVTVYDLSPAGSKEMIFVLPGVKVTVVSAGLTEVTVKLKFPPTLIV